MTWYKAVGNAEDDGFAFPEEVCLCEESKLVSNTSRALRQNGVSDVKLYYNPPILKESSLRQSLI